MMRMTIRVALAVLLVALVSFSLVSARSAPAPAGRPLAHMVFFKLAENTPEHREQLVAACQKYLTDHQGTLYFSVGTRNGELTSEVNDTGFDVALHLVFASKADQDRYQKHPRHLEFIAKNQALWSGVRVFDSDLAPASAAR